MDGKIIEIVLTEEEQRFLKQFVTQIRDSELAFNMAIKKHGAAQKELWENIGKVFPGVPQDQTSKPNFSHKDDKVWRITYFQEEEAEETEDATEEGRPFKPFDEETPE